MHEATAHPALDRAADRNFTGFVIFFVCVFVALQISWVFDHDRIDELSSRVSAALVAGLVLGMLCMWIASRPWIAPAVRSLLSRLSHALWPSIALLFVPFHVRLYCRWRNECDYWNDFFLIQFVAVAILTFLATLFASPESVTRFFRTRVSGSRLVRTAARNPYLLATLMCFALLLFRGWGRFIHAEFFAEGGWVFLAEALADGWHSLAYFRDGFVHIVPRLIVLTGLAVVPLKYLAHFSVSACFLITAAVSALIVRDGYRWLIPSDATRWGIAVLLCLVPGFFEMLGTLATLHYELFMLIGLLLLKDPRSTISPLEFFVITLATLSTGLELTLVPLALARLGLRRVYQKQRPSLGYAKMDGWELAALLMVLVPSFLLAADVLWDSYNTGVQAGYEPRNLTDLFAGMTNTLVIYYFLHALAGNVIVTEIMPLVPVLPLLAIFLALSAVLLYQRWRADRVATVFFLLWLAGMLALPAMIFIARPNGFVFFLTDKHWGDFAWWMRYNYLVAFPATIYWFVLLRPTDILALHSRSTVFTVMLLITGMFTAQYIFPVYRLSKFELWERSSAVIETSRATGCPRVMRIPLEPQTHFIYTNKDSKRTDCPNDYKVVRQAKSKK